MLKKAILSPEGSGGNVGIGVITQDLIADLAQAFSIKINKGAVVSRVYAGSAAAEAG